MLVGAGRKLTYNENCSISEILGFLLSKNGKEEVTFINHLLTYIYSFEFCQTIEFRVRAYVYKSIML
jgi:hypothetical protein